MAGESRFQEGVTGVQFPADVEDWRRSSPAAEFRDSELGGRLVEAIPSLGTGKVDLRAVRQLAAGSAEAVAS